MFLRLFTGHWWDNDIALVRLAKAVPATPEEVSKIQTVELPEATDDLSWPADGHECVLKGWGCTQLGILIKSKNINI